ncbi:MAG: hypothetical protein LBO07_03560 [Coriobacteriales bacterium]|jgi:hypothetical protein|nr:hypothetical protein [Coriobacteriales bacterium]
MDNQRFEQRRQMAMSVQRNLEKHFSGRHTGFDLTQSGFPSFFVTDIGVWLVAYNWSVNFTFIVRQGLQLNNELLQAADNISTNNVFLYAWPSCGQSDSDWRLMAGMKMPLPFVLSDAFEGLFTVLEETIYKSAIFDCLPETGLPGWEKPLSWEDFESKAFMLACNEAISC